MATRAIGALAFAYVAKSLYITTPGKGDQGRGLGQMSGSYRRRREPPPPVSFPVAEYIEINECTDPDSDGRHAHVILYAKDGPIAGFMIDPELVEHIVERCRELFDQPGLARTH